jgi:crooked neck
MYGALVSYFISPLTACFPSQLREFDRVRTLYEKYIEACYLFVVSSLYSRSADANAHLPQFDPTNSAAWIKYAELETQLADYSRARGIFELGASQTPLSMPELLWKAYIDFEVEEGERARARALYERLAAASGHWKVWVAYAMFEAQPIQLPRDEREDEDDEDDDEEKEPKMVEGDLELARQVFQKGYKDLKTKGLKNEVSKTHPSSISGEKKKIMVSDDIRFFFCL